MSLILEALRKSELARRMGQSPVYRDGAPAQTMMLRGLTLGAGTLLVAALLLSFWLLHRAGSPEPPVPMAVRSTGTGTSTAAGETKPLTPSSSATGADNDSARRPGPGPNPPFAVVAGSAPQEVVGSSLPKPGSRSEPVAGDAPWLVALPDSFRRSLPRLTITIHVYAPDEGRRILYINNRPLVRGDNIDGIVVEEIVPEGAVLRSGSQRFRVPRPS